MLGKSVRNAFFLVVLAAVGLGSLTASASAGRKPRRDISVPTVVIDQSQGQADPTLNTPLRFTAMFSESVKGFRANDTTPPSAPSGLAASATQSSLTLSWNPSTDNVAVQSYTLWQDDVWKGGTTSTSYTFTGLACGKTYQLSVAAYDTSYNMSSRSSLNATTSACASDTTPPSAPSGLAASATQSSLTLSWNPSTDNVAVLSYTFWQDDVWKGGTPSTSYSFTGLACGRTYRLKVAAYDTSDNMSPQVSLTASTSACAGTTPPNRVDLTARFGSNLAQAMAWLAANPQPAIVTAGVYTTSAVLDIPSGADLVFANATIIPTNPAVSSIRVRGAGTRLTFAGTCRIGAVGARNSRLGNAEAAGLEFERASGFTITADALTIEGVAQDAIFSYRGSHDGVVAGNISAVNTGADSFHVTDGSYNLDFQASLLSVGSGDDGFAVVSYLSNGVRVRNVHWHDITVRNQRWGRGISVVGGDSITVDHGDVDGSAGAGVYIAAEPQYNTYGVDGVTMNVRIRNPDTLHIHNANVAVYSAQLGQTIANVSLTVDADPALPLVRKTGALPVSNVTVNGVAVS